MSTLNNVNCWGEREIAGERRFTFPTCADFELLRCTDNCPISERRACEIWLTFGSYATAGRVGLLLDVNIRQHSKKLLECNERNDRPGAP